MNSLGKLKSLGMETRKDGEKERKNVFNNMLSLLFTTRGKLLALMLIYTQFIPSGRLTFYCAGGG